MIVCHRFFAVLCASVRNKQIRKDYWLGSTRKIGLRISLKEYFNLLENYYKNANLSKNSYILREKVEIFKKNKRIITIKNYKFNGTAICGLVLSISLHLVNLYVT